MNSKPHTEWTQLSAPLLLTVSIFLACLFGIYTRPVGFLATLWPANAIMLGLLIRRPQSGSVLGWCGAAMAYMAADLLTGASLPKAALLNSANLIGVAAAYLVYSRFPPDVVRLKEPASMLCLLVSAAAGGVAAGIIGAAANLVLFGGGLASGWTLWFVTEFVNYVALLPVILAAPKLSGILEAARPAVLRKPSDLLPVLALLLSFVATLVPGGPGAIAFPVPALLWCALTFPVFPTAILTLLFAIWGLGVVASGYISGSFGMDDEFTLISLRMGIALIAVVPTMLASVMQSRNELIARLHHMAMHDALTGASNRNAFREDIGRLLADSRRQSAVMMIDLDHFKAVNDTHGHAAGDAVLTAFAARTRICLRRDDLIGRLGGEEFAVALADCPASDALALANRIRKLAKKPVILDDGTELTVTASIGLVIADNGPAADLDEILSRADTLVYRAKQNGRDRVEMADTATMANTAPRLVSLS